MQYVSTKAYRYLLLTILVCFTAFADVRAQFKSEDLLIDELVLNLRGKNAAGYANQFAPFDTVWRVVTKLVPASEPEAKRIANIRSNPDKIQQFDPQINQAIEQQFKAVLKKGTDSGLHWSEIMMVRYELEKMMLTKEMIGFEKVAPLRLQGYVYLMDNLTSKTYMVAVRNVFSFDNRIYGAEVVNVLEAQNIDEYYDKLAGERKVARQRLIDEMYGANEKATDSSAVAQNKAKDEGGANDEEDDDNDKKKKQLKKVLDRKLYIGKLDDEIRIELYLRSLQGSCPEPICGWEGIYKFGDNEEYIKLEVTKKADGKWHFMEASEEGAMELVLNGNTFTGQWISPQDKTEYEVKMEERLEVKPKKLYMLDEMIESL
ncbi:MAG: hypothetical protein EOP56_16330 [Sphingobacteriales bacterium]|nr:MAG: hypothetical protein EOP56_16330 [Sphingobacteriales bacterium]